MRKANQNIGILTARIAKYDIEMGAEREDAPHHEAVSGPHGGPNLWSGGGDQLQELLANDGLNEEIRKLLSESNF